MTSIQQVQKQNDVENCFAAPTACRTTLLFLCGALVNGQKPVLAKNYLDHGLRLYQNWSVCPLCMSTADTTSSWTEKT